MSAQQLYNRHWGPRRQGNTAKEQLPIRQRAVAQSGAGSSQAKEPEQHLSKTAQSEYISSDGRVKATLADAYVEQPGNSSTVRRQLMVRQPWNVSWQVSERFLQWNDEVQAQLVKQLTKEKLECSDEEVENRFQELFGVIPGLSERVYRFGPTAMARLLMNPAAVAERLLQLKLVFPGANVEQMVLRDTRLLVEQSLEEIAGAAAELRDILPADVNIDKLCQEHPSMLDVPSFKDALDEVKRLMPRLDISRALNTEPEIIFSTQRASSMIPYDAVPGSSW